MPREADGNRLHLLLERFERNVATCRAKGFSERAAVRIAAAEVLNWLGFRGPQARDWLDRYTLPTGDRP